MAAAAGAGPEPVRLNNILGIVGAQGYQEELPLGIRSLSSGARRNYLLGMVTAKEKYHTEYAIQRDNVNALKKEFSYGIKPDAELQTGDNLLMFAIKRNALRVGELLLQRGVNLSTIQSGLTPLMLAVKRNNYGFVNLLLRYGANVNEIGPHNHTALYVAAKNGNPQMIDLLLREGAAATLQLKTTDTYELPMNIVVNLECIPCIKSFIRAGADLTKRALVDPNAGVAFFQEMTPLELAQRKVEYFSQFVNEESRRKVEVNKEIIEILKEVMAQGGGGRHQRRKTRGKRKRRAGKKTRRA